MTTYRIKKGVRPHGGKLFRADPPLVADASRLVGSVLTTYKELGPYSYARDELEECPLDEQVHHQHL